MRIFLLISKKTKKQNKQKRIDCCSALGQPQVAWRGAGLGFQPRDGELPCPEAPRLTASWVPEEQSEAQM